MDWLQRRVVWHLAPALCLDWPLDSERLSPCVSREQLGEPHKPLLFLDDAFANGYFVLFLSPDHPNNYDGLSQQVSPDYEPHKDWTLCDRFLVSSLAKKLLSQD
jgi:hypothetical protein